MKKLVLAGWMCLSLSLGFVGCSDDDEIVTAPTDVVNDLSFTDTDDEGRKVEGVLVWTAPEKIDNISEYAVYASVDGKTRETLLGTVKAELPKPESSKAGVEMNIASGTDYAPYLIVVTKNSAGEAAEHAAVKVDDTFSGFYILNSGKWKANNSNLSLFDAKTQTLKKDVFTTSNGKGLGDTANDMVIYGSKMYVTVSTSNIIYILDHNGCIQKEFQPTEGGEPEQPRYVEAYGGKVYVSMYSGYVACIDTTSLEIEKRVKVGSYPEQLVASNNKLYVANSGFGEGNTVSVVDLSSLTEEKQIPVVLNPTEITADEVGNVYVISMGNYIDIKNTLQKIDPTTYEVTPLTNATKMVMGDDKLYLMYSQFKGDKTVNNFFSYNVNTGKIDDASFITDGSTIAHPYSLSVNPSTFDICIGESDYTNTGSMYIFSADGKLKTKIEDTFGINPMGAYFFNN